MSTTERHLKNKVIISDSQHRFTKIKFCVTNLISFCLVDEVKVVDVVLLYFSKAFDTEPHSILLDKSSCGISRFMVLWAKN